MGPTPARLLVYLLATGASQLPGFGEASAIPYVSSAARDVPDVRAEDARAVSTAFTFSQQPDFPTRDIGGITVIDTPIVRDAEQYAREHSNDYVFNHVMRSWLLGVVMIARNETLQREVDLEVHAVAAILHDLGWDQAPDAPHVSPDKRFEVDSAIGAREFIRNHEDGAGWEERRVQLVWDAIALHTQQSLFPFKEPEVQAAPKGIFMDLLGPIFGITPEDQALVDSLYPRTGFKDGFNETLIWLAHTKAATTYDTWMQPWGESYVEGYSAVGSRAFDVITAALEASDPDRVAN